MNIILTNEFHRSKALVRAQPAGYPGEYRINARQLRRVRLTLCGMTGCTCGGTAGQRGGNNPLVDATHDGGAILTVAE